MKKKKFWGQIKSFFFSRKNSILTQTDKVTIRILSLSLNLVP